MFVYDKIAFYFRVFYSHIKQLWSEYIKLNTSCNLISDTIKHNSRYHGEEFTLQNLRIWSAIFALSV